MTTGQPVLFDPAGLAPLYELPDADAKAPELVDLYLTEAEQLLSQARAALATGDLRTLERATHGLCGSSSLVGASRLRSEAESLEAAAERGQVADLVPRLEEAAATLQQTRPLLLAALEHPPVS